MYYVHTFGSETPTHSEIAEAYFTGHCYEDDDKEQALEEARRYIKDILEGKQDYIIEASGEEITEDARKAMLEDISVYHFCIDLGSYQVSKISNEYEYYDLMPVKK